MGYRYFRRNGTATPVSEPLAATLQRLGLGDQLLRLRILGLWQKAVGTRVADNAEPEAFGRGVLTVRARSAPWQQELSYLKETICEKLNEALLESGAGTKKKQGKGPIVDLRIVAGRLKKQRLAKPTWDAATAEESQKAKRAAQDIGDPELRQVFERFVEMNYRARRSPKG